MTEKELRRLNRHDILELLVEQSREASRLRLVLEEREERLVSMAASNERLKSKLDGKDEQIERLKGRLDEKDAQTARLKSKLDSKDVELEDMGRNSFEQLERLKAKLDSKDEEIVRLSERATVLEDRNSVLERDLEKYRSDRYAELVKSGFTETLLSALSDLL